MAQTNEDQDVKQDLPQNVKEENKEEVKKYEKEDMLLKNVEDEADLRKEKDRLIKEVLVKQ